MSLKTGHDNSLEEFTFSAPIMESHQRGAGSSMDGLRARIAESGDEPAAFMAAYYSWLQEKITVQLVAYWNPRTPTTCLHTENIDKNHLHLLEKTQSIIKGPLPRIRHWRQEDWLFHLWVGAPLGQWDRVLLEESLNILKHPMQKQLIREGEPRHA